MSKFVKNLRFQDLSSVVGFCYDHSLLWFTAKVYEMFKMICHRLKRSNVDIEELDIS